MRGKEKVSKKVSDFITALATQSTSTEVSEFKKLAKSVVEDTTQHFSVDYFNRMVIYDTLFMLGIIMLPTPNNSHLYQAGIAALAGDKRLQLSLKPSEDKTVLPQSASNLKSSSHLVLPSQFQMPLPVLLSHGSRITFNADSKKIASIHTLLLNKPLSQRWATERTFSSHIQTFNKNKNRIIDDKAALTRAFSIADVSNQQLEYHIGIGTPTSLSGTVSAGRGEAGSSIILTTFGNNKTNDQGALTTGLQTAAVGQTNNGHTHLGATPADMNLFETGPKIDVIMKNGFKQALKSKCDSLRVNLNKEAHQTALREILQMSEPELQRYAVGMLLELGRAVTVSEYAAIFQQLKASFDVIVGQNKPKSLQTALYKAEASITTEKRPVASDMTIIDNSKEHKTRAKEKNHVYINQAENGKHIFTYISPRGKEENYWLPADKYKKLADASIQSTEDSKELKKPVETRDPDNQKMIATTILSELRTADRIKYLEINLLIYISQRKKEYTFHDIACVRFFYPQKSGRIKESAANKFLSAVKGELVHFEEKDVLALTEPESRLAEIIDEYVQAGGELPQQFKETRDRIASERQERLIPEMVL